MFKPTSTLLHTFHTHDHLSFCILPLSVDTCIPPRATLAPACYMKVYLPQTIPNIGGIISEQAEWIRFSQAMHEWNPGSSYIVLLLAHVPSQP